MAFSKNIFSYRDRGYIARGCYDNFTHPCKTYPKADFLHFKIHKSKDYKHYTLATSSPTWKCSGTKVAVSSFLFSNENVELPIDIAVLTRMTDISLDEIIMSSNYCRYFIALLYVFSEFNLTTAFWNVIALLSLASTLRSVLFRHHICHFKFQHYTGDRCSLRGVKS